jgi:ATP-dependent phosphofructokinase / diphosphate-dependent phosphofructokinase
MAKIKRVGILTGGGDCPGLNAVIRAVTKTLILRYDIEVYGFEDGFLGMIEGRYKPLNYDSVSGILQAGGTILGTSNKANPLSHPTEINGKIIYQDMTEQTLCNFNALNLDVLVAIGGDGTMTISKGLIEKGIPIVGIPKTIDNDIVGTDITFGFDTAVAIAADAMDRIHTTAMSHHRVMLVEIMGRYAGWLTLNAGIASGADLILIPEIDFDVAEICHVVMDRSKRGRRFSMIAVSEGSKPIGGQMTVQRVVEDSPDKIRLGGISIKLGNEIEDLTGLETRATVLGHLQRGGTPTAYDRILATRYGVAAADLIGAGELNRMIALRANSITSVPIKDVGGKNRTVSHDDPLLGVAVSVGTSMGIKM